MRINEQSVPEKHQSSPKKMFELYRKHISLALGGIKDTGPWGGGQPFDVELVRIPSGKSNYPYHSHAAQTEYYIILLGTGMMVDGSGTHLQIKAGDHMIIHPGEAHQVVNNSEVDLVYYVIADHHRAEVTTYPHTNKRQIKPEMRVVKLEEVDYYEGEE